MIPEPQPSPEVGTAVPAINCQPPKTTRKDSALRAVTGAALGVLALFVYSDLLRGVIPYIGKTLTIAAVALLAGWAGMGRARKAVWAFALTAFVFAMIVAFSPLVPMTMRGLLRSDPLEKAPAVLVLAAGVDRRGVLSPAAHARLARALELLGQGYAGRLVLTETRGPHNSWAPSVRRYLTAIGLNYPIDTLGPVVNTHDEAVMTADLARKRGWDRILLVTHPWHMRRSAALFDRLGLRVICAPCEELDYDPYSPELGRARVTAFRDLAHEIAALFEYRARDWIR